MALQQKLRQLFLVDQQVRGLRTRLEAAQRRGKVQQDRLIQLQRQHQELLDQLRHTQAAAAAQEMQVKECEARIETLRQQMNTVRNNKEYAALLLEVSTLKDERGKAEDQALETMAKADALKKDGEALAAKIVEQEKLTVVAGNEVTTAGQEVGDQLTRLEQQRDAAARELPDDVLAAFNHLANVHDGEALANVVEEDRRNHEYTCGGCYIGLPIERVNALLTRPDTVSCCPSCGRILYVEEELRAAIGSNGK